MKNINILVLFRFAFIVPIIELSLRLFGFNKTVFILNCFCRSTVKDKYGVNVVNAHKASLFYFYQKFPFAGKCLARSLSLWFLLNRKGIKTDIRFGMRKEGEVLLAHAWVEYKGTPLTLDPKVRQDYSLFAKPII